jgi:hypothetical protein
LGQRKRDALARSDRPGTAGKATTRGSRLSSVSRGSARATLSGSSVRGVCAGCAWGVRAGRRGEGGGGELRARASADGSTSIFQSALPTLKQPAAELREATRRAAPTPPLRPAYSP